MAWLIGVLVLLAGDARGLEVVNQPPTFEPGPDVEANEDDLTQTHPGWAKSIRAGSADEAAQSVRFEVTNKDSTLFSVPPAIDAEGTLSFTPARGAFGSVVVTVVAVDDGGTETGGFDESEPVDFLITIHPVNDAPVFEIHAAPVVGQDSGPVTLANWAYRIGPGSQFEVGQNFTFAVTNNASRLFAVPPTISPDGTLNFAPASGASGEASVTVVLRDDGGAERGGVDTSAPVVFTITIVPGNHPPVPVVTTSGGCWLSADAVHLVAIASAGGRASVDCDASRSFDVDGDSLRYQWSLDGVPLADEVRAKTSLSLDVGEYWIRCVVNDGDAEGIADVEVEVILASDAVRALSQEMTELALHRGVARMLRRSLQQAERCFEEGRWTAGLRHLIHFEQDLRRRIPGRHGAESLIQHSREIRRMVRGGPGGR